MHSHSLPDDTRAPHSCYAPARLFSSPSLIQRRLFYEIPPRAIRIAAHVQPGNPSQPVSFHSACDAHTICDGVVTVHPASFRLFATTRRAKIARPFAVHKPSCSSLVLLPVTISVGAHPLTVCMLRFSEPRDRERGGPHF